MSVQLISTIEALRLRVAAARRSQKTVGLAPTMGALHAGHIRLIDQAVQDCDLVIVTLFVNPTQFNQPDDFEQYPRTIEHDLAVCEEHSADVLFAPSVEEMYPGRERTFVEVTHLTDHLCGPYRPGHFRGVATVVAKLLNIAQADRAYFGEKDAQQLAVIKRHGQGPQHPDGDRFGSDLARTGRIGAELAQPTPQRRRPQNGRSPLPSADGDQRGGCGGRGKRRGSSSYREERVREVPGSEGRIFRNRRPRRHAAGRDDPGAGESGDGGVGGGNAFDRQYAVCAGRARQGLTEKRKQRVGGPRFRDDGFGLTQDIAAIRDGYERRRFLSALRVPALGPSLALRALYPRY